MSQALEARTTFSRGVFGWDLTPREQEVTRLILQGAATEQIAKQPVISVHTVRQPDAIR